LSQLIFSGAGKAATAATNAHKIANFILNLLLQNTNLLLALASIFIASIWSVQTGHYQKASVIVKINDTAVCFPKLLANLIAAEPLVKTQVLYYTFSNARTSR
jgi:hypothetical protein